MPVIKANISDKKVSNKMEPSKDFGSFSALLAPSLLTGKTAVSNVDVEETSEKRNRLSTSNTLTSSSTAAASNLSTTSKYSTSSQLKTDRKDDSYNYSSSFHDKYETNNNLNSSSSGSAAFAEDNNNAVNRYKRGVFE